MAGASAPQERSRRRRRARLRTTGMLLVLLPLAMLSLYTHGVPHTSAQSQPSATNAIKPFLYGQVSINGKPVDDGTHVDAVVVRGVDDYTVCGETTVGQSTAFMDTHTIGPGAYILPIDTSPRCLDPQVQYTLFVNQVNAGQLRNPGFTAAGGQARMDVSVPEVVLVSDSQTNGASSTPPADRSIPVVYFYGTVRTQSGPAKAGTQVMVRSQDGSCSATARTQDLSWQPKAAPGQSAQPIHEVGFYWVGVVGGSCANRSVPYNFYASGALTQSAYQVSTPPYGTAQRVDLYTPIP
jgi:hypothetical protein